MDYSKLSDFEINKRIAEREGVRGFNCENVGGGSALKFSNWKELDYCNNPADAWPIIIENGISILKDKGLHLWCATSSAYWEHSGQWKIGREIMDENPLRAAMICYLIMQESE